MYALEPQQQIPSDDVPLRSVWVGVSHTNARMSGRSERDINLATRPYSYPIETKSKVRGGGTDVHERNNVPLGYVNFDNL